MFPLKDQNRLTFVEHLEELRLRIIKSIVFFIVISFAFFPLVKYIIPIIMKPVGKLIAIHPAESLMVYLSLTFLGGIIISFPFILYQIWSFVNIALKKTERSHAYLFGGLSFLFFIIGALFGFYVVVPMGIRFLLDFTLPQVETQITISNYVSFVGTMVLSFGIIFEFPVIAIFLTKAGILTSEFLGEGRKWAIVIIFIISSVITPPDILTQLLLAGPMILLYELSVIAARWMIPTKKV